MRIMIIDPYDSMGTYFEKLLKENRPEYTLCAQSFNPEQARQQAEALQPDVIICEPLMFGHSPQRQLIALNELQQKGAGAKIVVLSASQNREHILAALRAGAADYLMKPVNWQELLNVLDRVSGRDQHSADNALLMVEGRTVLENIVSHIQHGNSGDAIRLIRQEIGSSWAKNSYSERCVTYIEIATQLIHLPDTIDRVPDELIDLYRTYMKEAAQHADLAELDSETEAFLRSCGEIFNRLNRDIPYHQIQEVIAFVEEHLSEELSLNRVSKQLYISPTYFSRLFKAKTGKTFSDYLAERRVRRACELLAGSTAPVSEISRMVGYSEPNSFTRLFKKQTGLSPSQYRHKGGTAEPDVLRNL